MSRSPVLQVVAVIGVVLAVVFVVAAITLIRNESVEPNFGEAEPFPSGGLDAPVATQAPGAGGSPDLLAVPLGASTPPNLRVAFIGDQGIEKPARDVLALIRNEGANALILLGDFDYEDDADGWDAMLTEGLGATFPIFAVPGNHDESIWPAYRTKLTNRLPNIEGARCVGDYGVNAACTYRNLYIILSGAGTEGRNHAAFIQNALASNNNVWSVCAWHKNQEALQLGEKNNETGWDVYERCRAGGAIIATAHEHSYQRTKTLSNMQSQTIDPAWPSPTELRVGNGSSFVFVSGLGGHSERGQERCHPTTPPYGCNGIWASVYTKDQGAVPGALFIDFHVDNDPRKARGYFKDIRGRVVDQFTVVSEVP